MAIHFEDSFHSLIEVFCFGVKDISEVKLINDFDKAVSYVLDDQKWTDIREEEIALIKRTSIGLAMCHSRLLIFLWLNRICIFELKAHWPFDLI